MEDLCKFLHFEFDSKINKPISCLERQVLKNLQEANLKIRPANTNGLWCHFLLPAILLVYTCSDEVQLLYKLTSFISLGLLCYCTLFIFFLSSSNIVLKAPIYTGCLASSLLATIFIHVFLNQGLLFSISITLSSTILFAWLLRLCLTECSYTFTLGEAMIVSQAVVLFTAMSVIKYVFGMYSDDLEMEFVSIIVYTVLLAVAMIITALYSLSESQRNLKTLGFIVGLAAVLALITLHLALGMNCLFTIINYVFIERNRIKLVLFWILLVALAICALYFRTKQAVKANTVTRKIFHVLASFVFLSGILFDTYIMTLAAGVGFGVLVLVEALRKSGIEPISSALQSAFLIYSDEKDCGMFAMTPIYLYVGLAYPLLVVPNRDDRVLELLCGVLSIGVGDTAASWFGSNFGTAKWSNSHKTLEGTLVNVLSQLITVYILQISGAILVHCALSRTLLCAWLSALLEARTAQVDNLVLPLAALAALQLARLVY